MICSSLYLLVLVLMSVILQVDGLRYLYDGMAGRRQVTSQVDQSLALAGEFICGASPRNAL